MKKVRGHPDFQNFTSAQVKKQAKKLTEIESLKEYFSEYLALAQDNVLQVTNGRAPARKGVLQVSTATADDSILQVNTAPQDNVLVQYSDLQVSAASTQDSVLQVTAALAQDSIIQVDDLQIATEEQATAVDTVNKPDPFSRIRNVAAFPVKLYLTSLPADSMITDGNDYASMLETQYGPMHASLQIGHIMIEWTTHSLVVPHSDIPTEPVIKTDITRSLTIASELQEKASEYKRSRRGTVTGEVDLKLEITKSVSSLLETIVQVIATWNRYKYFDAYGSNSQHFVQTIIAHMGIEELPQLQNPTMDAYIGKLKGDFRTEHHTSFERHADLDRYVGERVGKLSTREMEYLLTEYYRFHVAGRAGAMRGDGEWRCTEGDCQMQRLEREIDGKELLITSLRPT